VSHIPKFGDAPSSSAGDLASPVIDGILCRERYDASLNFGIYARGKVRNPGILNPTGFHGFPMIL